MSKQLVPVALFLLGAWLLANGAAEDSSALLTGTRSVAGNTFATATAFPDSVSRASAWTSGLSHTAATGPNRLLVFAVGYENCASDPLVSAVSYGGRALTRITGAAGNTGCWDRTELWYLNESNIAAAVGSTFTVTWGGAAPTDPMYAAATYTHVSQTTPVAASATNSTDTSTPNPLTAALSASAGQMAIATIISGNGGSYTWNNSFLEQTDQQSVATTTMSTAEKSIAATGTETASATHSGPNRQAIVAALLNPDPVSRLNSWTTGLTHTAASGTNRVLVFAAGYEECAGWPVIAAVTYGGQSMTRATGANTTSGCDDGAELWYLNEAGLQAASGNAFSVTWSGSAATDPLYAAATYGYVLQSAPIYDTDATFSNAATPNPINLNINGLIRAVGIGIATAGNDGSYTWGQATETTDQTRNVTVTVSTAEGVFPSTGPVISGATHSGPNRQAIAGIVLTPD